MGAVRTTLLRAALGALAAKPGHGAPGLLWGYRGVWTNAPGGEEAPLNFYDSTIEEVSEAFTQRAQEFRANLPGIWDKYCNILQLACQARCTDR